VWQLNTTAKEVVVTNMTDSDDDLTNPAKLLANYAKNYRPKFIREDEDGTAVVDLQPKKARQYHKLRLFINAKTGALKKIEQHNYDSTRSEYVVSNFKGARASDGDFTYTAAHGIEVVDMR
ncbi:MAG: outer-membrane lipoprotein carrier protein LolA, partial [Bacteroidales bacterium]|nr:outer-membrane lipoprotein carrier protein LolA [Bacteroidales bacterium]